MSENKFLSEEAKKLVEEARPKYIDFLNVKIKMWSMGFDVDFDFVTYRSNAGIDGFTIIDAAITLKY